MLDWGIRKTMRNPDLKAFKEQFTTDDRDRR
jgi:hypothetical protein